MKLITGHRGFIGSALTKLVDAICIDVRDGYNLLTCSLPDGIDTVFHLAAQSDVQASWNDPLHDLDNIRITARLAHEYPQAKIIYANSCASMDKSSPYGFSKAASADYLRTFHTKTVDCVFPNIFGPGSRSVVDIFKSSESVTIFGNGTHTRDYVHVDDIVQALILAQDWHPGIYYLGSEKSTSVLDLARNKHIDFLPPKREASEVSVPNTTPNWKPRINVLDYLYA